MSDQTDKKAARAATTTALGAVACAACCALPFALPAVTLASIGSILAWLANAPVWMTGLAILVTTGAWLWIWRRSARLRARPPVSTLYMMGVATMLVVLAILWPALEPLLIRALIE